MALGKRKVEQQSLLVATTSLPQSPGHPFYEKLNKLLAEASFDPYQPVEEGSFFMRRRGVTSTGTDGSGAPPAS